MHIKVSTEIAPSPFAHKVRIVGRRTDADSFSSTTEKIAHAMRQALEIIGCIREGVHICSFPEDLVVYDIVVSRPGGAMEGSVGLQEKVPVAGLSDAAVDDGADTIVGGPRISFLSLRGIETGVVAFADNDDGDFWKILLLVRRRVQIDASFAQKREIGVQDRFVLTFGVTIAVYEDIFRKCCVLPLRFP